MTQRSRPQHNNNDFDLDAYLNEKASGETEKAPKPRSEAHGGNFFKNLMAISALLIVAVLYTHDWNPMNVYNRFFPSEAEVSTAPVAPTINEERLARIADREARAAVRQEQRQAEQAELIAVLEARRAEQAQRVARTAAPVANTLNPDDLVGMSEEELAETIEKITTESILAASNALNEIDWAEFGQQFENLGAQIEAELLQELATDPQQFNIPDDATINLSQSDYNDQLKTAGITQFSNRELRALRNAEVPVSFLTILDKSGRLSNYTADEIIEFFK